MTRRRWLRSRIARCLAAIILIIAAGSGPTATARPAELVAPMRCHRPVPLVWITQDNATGGTSSSRAQPLCAPHLPVDATITVEPGRRLQRILGFGAALTGSSTWLLQTGLDARARRAVLLHLFAAPPVGINLSLMRLPIGSTDLSRRRYSFAPHPPPKGGPPMLDLSPMEDNTLPILQAALAINPTLRLIASPWTAPAWMKTNHSLIGGRLQAGQELNFADYLVQYLQQMQLLGVPIYGLTLQNEPNIDPTSYPGMLMPADQAAHVIDAFLGPMLARQHLDTRIFALDDNWMWVHDVIEMLDDQTASRFIKGVAWHCYGGSASVQDLIHRQDPSLIQVLSECSDGNWAPNDQEGIAGFVQAVFINPLRRWDSGVILWGLALDPDGGPHDGGCGICTPVVTIDAVHDQADFTRDYYALAHFSEFVPPGSYRVASSTPGHGLTDVAFSTADGGTLAVVIANRNIDAMQLRVDAGTRSSVVAVPAKSVTTVVFSSHANPIKLVPPLDLSGGHRARHRASAEAIPHRDARDR